jgi:hypothetical protein
MKASRNLYLIIGGMVMGWAMAWKPYSWDNVIMLGFSAIIIFNVWEGEDL